MTEIFPLEIREYSMWWLHWAPFGGLHFSLLCNAYSELNNELAYERKGSELYSDLLGIEFTLLIIVVGTRPSDPMSGLCCVDCFFLSYFYKGLLSGLDPVLTYRRWHCRQDLSTLYSVVKHCHNIAQLYLFIGLTRWFLLINILSFTKFVFFLL